MQNVKITVFFIPEVLRSGPKLLELHTLQIHNYFTSTSTYIKYFSCINNKETFSITVEIAN